MSQGDEKKPLGKILLQQRLISQRELDEALRDQRQPAGGESVPLASRLTERGVVGEVDAIRALSQQHGVPGIDLTQLALCLEHLSLVPREVAEGRLILPALVKDDSLFLAMATPNDQRALDELEFVTGKKVYPYVTLSATLRKVIGAAYDAKERGELFYFGVNVPEESRQLALQGGAEGVASAIEHDLPNLPEVSGLPVAAAPPPLPVRPRSLPPGSPAPPSTSIAPGAPAVILDRAMIAAGGRGELETSEIGNMVADEVSVVAQLPEELRGSAPLNARKSAPDYPTPAPTPRAAAAGSPGSKVILVVDDEEDIRKMLRRLLAEKGHRVIEADRGTAALRMVKEHTPDLIVLDAMLPELHGFDVARRIKGSERYGHIPIIMISAVYRGWRIAEDLKTNYGIEEFIEKPFRITDVLKAVTRLLNDRDEKKRREPEAASARDPEAMNAAAERSLQQGVDAYRAGDTPLAIQHLKEGIRVDPLAYRLRYHLALLYGKQGMLYEGIGELERAVDLNPKHFPALKNLAVLYEKAGFRHKAVELWERGARIAPDEATRETIKRHLVDLL